MNTSWINKQRRRILVHALAWLIVFSLPYLLVTQYDPNRPRNPDSSGFFYLNTLTDLLWIGVFYVNAHLLIAPFVYRRRYGPYILWLLAIFSVVLAIHGLMFTVLIHSRPFILLNSLVFNLPPFVLSVAVSATYRMVTDRAKADNLAKEQQEENLKTELSFLRSQISPHFMFNVLNNLIALIRMKSDQLEPVVFKLSSLMRYMIYETDEKKVSLKKEIEYLRNYIDLQQLRFGDKVKLAVSLQVPDNYLEIEPMLLIPFIENAFKHGTVYIQQPQIDVALCLNDHVLSFSVRNRYGDVQEEKDESSGIGLANVQRRLNLLYGKGQQLAITQKDHWFSVSLQINLR